MSHDDQLLAGLAKDEAGPVDAAAHAMDTSAVAALADAPPNQVAAAVAAAIAATLAASSPALATAVAGDADMRDAQQEQQQGATTASALPPTAPAPKQQHVAAVQSAAKPEQHRRPSVNGEAMHTDEEPDDAPTTPEDEAGKQLAANGPRAANGIPSDQAAIGTAHGASAKQARKDASADWPAKCKQAMEQAANGVPHQQLLKGCDDDTDDGDMPASNAPKRRKVEAAPAAATHALPAAAPHAPAAAGAATKAQAGGGGGAPTNAHASAATAAATAGPTVDAAAPGSGLEDAALDAAAALAALAGGATGDAAAASGAAANCEAAGAAAAETAAPHTAAAARSAGADAAGPSTSAAAATADAPAAANGAAAANGQAPAVGEAGPPLPAEASQHVKDTLAAYRARVKVHIGHGRAKPDMIAFKELRDAWCPPLAHGHMPGVPVGMELLGRGEAAILGIHTLMMAGIDYRQNEAQGAYAIALSGGYKDDDDSGARFWYTGFGGQSKGKKQTRDQEWKAGNLALQRSHTHGTPVRVLRGKVGAARERLYVYEGLYKVVEAKLEPSKDGPKVCRFLMEAIPGESRVSTQVTFNGMNRSHWARILLAGPMPAPGQKRAKAFRVPKRQSREQLLAAIRRRAAAGEQLLCEDIANGAEEVPIPLWNDVDAEGIPAFTYTGDYQFSSPAAQAMAETAETLFKDACPIICGRQWMKDEAYNEQGLVISYIPSGIMECDLAEPCCCNNPACARNTVVAWGIALPLEVFRTQGKGYGVRCTVDIPVGSYICSYIGLVMTSDEAEEKREEDWYLFDLDHYQQLAAVAADKAARAAAARAARQAQAAAGEEGQQEQQQEEDAEDELNPNLPALPDLLSEDHLVIDANTDGNVARFINHSCEPNCIVQAVFTKLCRSQALYYVAIVAQRDIPAMKELTYDYGYKKVAGQGQGRVMCTCGAPNCVGILL